jgi:hypothetical protein
MSKHTSINCCEFGADLVTTDPTTGQVKMVQWTWAEVEEFVDAHGIDVTETVGTTVGEFLGAHPEATPRDGKLRCSLHNQVWPCHVCAGQERGG